MNGALRNDVFQCWCQLWFFYAQRGQDSGLNEMYCLLLLEYYGHTVLDGVGGFCIGATGEFSLYDNCRA